MVGLLIFVFVCRPHTEKVEYDDIVTAGDWFHLLLFFGIQSGKKCQSKFHVVIG